MPRRRPCPREVERPACSWPVAPTNAKRDACAASARRARRARRDRPAESAQSRGGLVWRGDDQPPASLRNASPPTPASRNVEPRVARKRCDLFARRDVQRRAPKQRGQIAQRRRTLLRFSKAPRESPRAGEARCGDRRSRASAGTAAMRTIPRVRRRVRAPRTIQAPEATMAPAPARRCRAAPRASRQVGGLHVAYRFRAAGRNPSARRSWPATSPPVSIGNTGTPSSSSSRRTCRSRSLSSSRLSRACPRRRGRARSAVVRR